MSFNAFRVPPTFFGCGAVAQVGECAAGLGKTALLLTGSRSADASGATAKVEGSLSSAGVRWFRLQVGSGEPTDSWVDRVREALHRHGCELLIAVGGGSVLDLGKCAAGLYRSEASTHGHMVDEAAIPATSLPWIAVPTTAGSGAEMTPNAVIIDEQTGIKKSLRSWGWLAKAAIVDPELTLTLPPKVTAFTGMDAFTQAIESFTSIGATPLTESISMEAARLLGRSIRRAVEEGDDLGAREDMAWGASMAGMALANARLGAVHGFAHPVGTHLNLPHGLACAILLPWVMEYNRSVAEEKYARLAEALGLHRPGEDGPQIGAARLITFVRELNESFGIPPSLAAVGLTAEAIPSIVRETLPSGSLAANPRRATEEDLYRLLEMQLAE